MPKRHPVQNISKTDPMSKFPAWKLALQRAKMRQIPLKIGFFAGLLTASRFRRAIDLESAAFVFHMTVTIQGITGSLRAACSEPVQRFLACPFS